MVTVNKERKMKKTKVLDLTPELLRCPPIGMPHCPAIFEHGDGFTLVGKLLNPDQLPNEIMSKVGPGEVAIHVPKALLSQFDIEIQND